MLRSVIEMVQVWLSCHCGAFVFGNMASGGMPPLFRAVLQHKSAEKSRNLEAL